MENYDNSQALSKCYDLAFGTLDKSIEELKASVKILDNNLSVCESNISALRKENAELKKQSEEINARNKEITRDIELHTRRWADIYDSSTEFAKRVETMDKKKESRKRYINFAISSIKNILIAISLATTILVLTNPTTREAIKGVFIKATK